MRPANPARDSAELYRVVVDPGVLVSARISFGGQGATAGVLLAWFEGRFEMIVSEELLGELEQVMLRPKFHRYTTPEEVTEYVELLRRTAILKSGPAVSRSLTPDPKDDYLVALSRSSGAHFLVAGDPHLTQLSNPEPPVLTPRTFLEVLEAAD